MTTPLRADVCVIGGGLVGCFTAYHLAKRGADVILLERERVGAGSSFRGMGGFRHQFADAVDAALVRASLPILRSLAPEAVFQRGYLFVAESEAGAAELRAGTERMRGLGVEVRDVDRHEIASLVPGLRVDDLAGGRFGPADGYAEPRRILERVADEARALGVRFAEGQDVRAIRARDGAITSVDSTSLAIVPGSAVVACGAWSAPVLATCGVDVPIWGYRRQLAQAGPFPSLARIPMTIEWESGLHFRPKGEADQLFAMPNVAPDGSLEKAPASRGRAEPLVVDQRALEWTRAKAARRHPAFAALRFTASWACYYEMTPDDHPILSAVPEVGGLYLAAGFSGHGFMQSAAVGLGMSELLLDGAARSVDLAPFSIERFRSGRSPFSPSVL